MRVDLYSKPDCHLCDEAKAVLLAAQAKVPFELKVIDIEKEPALLEQYKHDIPVVFIEGRKAFKHRVDEAQLLKKLERAQAASRSQEAEQAPVSRRAKTAFAVFALVLLGTVAAAKIYQVYFQPEQLALLALDYERGLDAAPPPLELKDHTGKVVKLSDYAGKTVLLNFWATWCPPCRDEMPSMEQLAAAMKSEPSFVMLAASVDDGWAPIDEFFKGQPAPGFTVLHDENARGATAFGTSKFPETYIIGPDGRLKAKFVGPRDWSDKALPLFFRKIISGASV